MLKYLIIQEFLIKFPKQITYSLILRNKKNIAYKRKGNKKDTENI